MGYVSADNIQVTKAKSGRICLRYRFINKNGVQDDLYLEITDELLNKLNSTFQIIRKVYKH